MYLATDVFVDAVTDVSVDAVTADLLKVALIGVARPDGLWRPSDPVVNLESSFICLTEPSRSLRLPIRHCVMVW